MERVSNSDLEFKTKMCIKNEQVSRLRELVKYTSKNSSYYKKILKKIGLRYSNIKSFNDISKLPITTKSQLEKYNRNLYCVKQKEIAEVVSTTGTTGEPVFIILTKRDLSRLGLNEARSFYCAGVCCQDLFHIAVTLDSMFMAGMAYYLGITKLGASAYRAGMHNIKKHIQWIRKLKPTGIVTVPSFLLKLIEGMKEEMLNPQAISIKKALLVGESIRDKNFNINKIGALISKSSPIELYSTYGNSEGAISFCECQYHVGGHEHPDLIISEILDEKGNSVQDGELGELVLTTLQTEGMPLLRYRTGDITFKLTTKCQCGRNSSRIGPVIGRKSQMMKFKGVKVYPKAIENAIIDTEGVFNYVVEAYTGDDHSDNIIVRIGCREKSEKLREDVCRRIEAHAKVTPCIELTSVEEVDSIRTDGGIRRKTRFFIDNRHKK